MDLQNSNQLTLFGNQLTESASDSFSDSGSHTAITISEIVCDTEQKSELIMFLEQNAERLWSAEKTRQNSVTRVRRFDAFRDNSKLKIADITALNIYDWLDHERLAGGRKGEGISDASANRYASAMSALLTFAVECKLRDDSPKLRYRHEFSRERYMTLQEIDELVCHFTERGDQWMADLVFVGVNTGMRLGEILELGIVNCGKNSHRGEATIQTDAIHLPAKITKTKKGRYVSINETVRDACVRLSSSIGTHFTHRKFYDRWDDARQKVAPNDKEFVFHCLRHTCASMMANDLKMNSLIIGDQLGHKSERTTAKYVHKKAEEAHAFTSHMTLGSSALQATGATS